MALCVPSPNEGPGLPALASSTMLLVISRGRAAGWRPAPRRGPGPGPRAALGREVAVPEQAVPHCARPGGLPPWGGTSSPEAAPTPGSGCSGGRHHQCLLGTAGGPQTSQRSRPLSAFQGRAQVVCQLGHTGASFSELVLHLPDVLPPAQSSPVQHQVLLQPHAVQPLHLPDGGADPAGLRLRG